MPSLAASGPWAGGGNSAARRWSRPSTTTFRPPPGAWSMCPSHPYPSTSSRDLRPLLPLAKFRRGPRAHPSDNFYNRPALAAMTLISCCQHLRGRRPPRTGEVASTRSRTTSWARPGSTEGKCRVRLIWVIMSLLISSLFLLQWQKSLSTPRQSHRPS